jgi:hypothetical protein
MRAMIRTRASRSLVALITALLLMVCQTAFAAQACAHNFAPAEVDVTTPPCHGALDNSGSPAKQAPAATSGCEVANALTDAAKVPVFALSDLQTVVVTYLDLPAPRHTSHPIRNVQAVCHSPPLSILHCRFLN